MRNVSGSEWHQRIMDVLTDTDPRRWTAYDALKECQRGSYLRDKMIRAGRINYHDNKRWGMRKHWWMRLRSLTNAL